MKMHYLALQWFTEKGVTRTVTIELNGSRLTRTHPSQDPDRQSSSWDSIPVSEFGITKRERKESYVVRISVGRMLLSSSSKGVEVNGRQSQGRQGRS